MRTFIIFVLSLTFVSCNAKSNIYDDSEYIIFMDSASITTKVKVMPQLIWEEIIMDLEDINGIWYQITDEDIVDYYRLHYDDLRKCMGDYEYEEEAFNIHILLHPEDNIEIYNMKFGDN